MTLRRNYYFGIRVGGGGYGPSYSSTASQTRYIEDYWTLNFECSLAGKLTNLPIKMCYGYRGDLTGSLRTNM